MIWARRKEGYQGGGLTQGFEEGENSKENGNFATNTALWIEIYRTKGNYYFDYQIVGSGVRKHIGFLRQA